MNQQDAKAFKDLLTNVMAFYRQDVSTFMLSVWWEAGKPFEYEQVARALTAHATNPDGGQFAPKPADLVKHLSGTATDRAMLAWGKALDSASRVGAYSDIVFDDPAIHAVIEDLGGWPKFCRSETKDLSYLQHRFCEGYRAYSGRQQFDYPRRLSGDLYTKRGLPPPKPTVIGDVEMARKVYRLGSSSGKTAVSFQALAALESAPRLLPIGNEESA